MKVSHIECSTQLSKWLRADAVIRRIILTFDV